MSDLSRSVTNLPPEQVVIRAKCFHPTGNFVEFKKEEVEQSIPQRFEKIARKYPERIAVKTQAGQVTYDALNRAANRLAHAILALRGEGREPVALFLEHGVFPIVANLAVLKTGKISLQLDPSAPTNRTAHLLQDSQALLIVTNKKNESVAREWAGGERLLINLDERESNLGDQNLALRTPSDAHAYIRYTSGSTGQAKGAVKTHRHVLHAVLKLTNDFHLSVDDHISHIGRESLGKHVFEALLNGATLYPMDIREEGLVHLADWLIREEITSYQSFPTAFRHFVSTLTGEEQFPKLRLIRLEGEPLYQRDVELYKKHFSSECFLVNSYSAAETGTICRYFVEKNTNITSGHVPVGYLLEDMQVLLLDEAGREVGFNQRGEIAVKSRFLSSGYWQRPEITGEKFHGDPDGVDQPVYLTGDLGEMSANGCLEYFGRKDFQVKIRSFRVDVGEVEAALADHVGIKEVSVVAREDRSGNTRLVAYLVSKNHPAPTATSLRDFLKEKLPEYMIPSVFMLLDTIPLTATGKVDRRALPEPDTTRPEMDTLYVPPQTDIERKLAHIWEEVLDIRPIGIDDNFFNLGGHSLAATRVVSQVMKQFQLEIPLQSLFQSPTVGEMAAAITEHQGKKLGEEKLERVLAELESLTDEEAQRVLAEQSRTEDEKDRNE